MLKIDKTILGYDMIQQCIGVDCDNKRIYYQHSIYYKSGVYYAYVDCDLIEFTVSDKNIESLYNTIKKTLKLETLNPCFIATRLGITNQASFTINEHNNKRRI